MPQLTVTSSTLSSAGAGVPSNTGAAFVVGITDQGPPLSGPSYVACQSISAYVTAFGPRSSTSAVLYDWLDEYFHDSNGGIAYVARVTDNTAVAAALTLSDKVPHPSVVVTAQTAGVDGNAIYVQVLNGTAATFTMTASTTASATAISSFANIGVGTLITGTNIAANTYITAVNPGAGTATLSTATTGAAGTVTPATFTVQIQNSAGDVLETHGPFATTAQLYADLTSTMVLFSQSAGSGFTANQPNVAAAAALTGGANPNDLSASSYVTALDLFPSGLGPGSVAIPGQVGNTIWTGLLSHAQAKNRFAILDMTDSATVATVTTAAAALTSGVGSYGMFIQGSLTLPGIAPGTTRTCPGSAAVAALRAQVGQGPSQNVAPCGPKYPLTYPQGFTEYYGPSTSASLPGGAFHLSDVQTLEAAGVNVFANFAGVSCLFGFVTPISKTVDATYWQATASCERMALVSDATTVAAPFLFTTIDGSGNDATALATALMGVITRHFQAGALFGTSASDAGQVNIGSPINTPQTAQAGQLNANLQVRLSPYADTVNVTITTVPIVTAVA